MKTIGLIGGMSWESSAHYYRLINEGVKQRLGGLHSAQLLMLSIDFAPIEEMQRRDDWDGAAASLADAARRLQLAGADLLLIGSNTMHRVAPEVGAAIDIPLLHIADATGEALGRDRIARVGLLGTAYTMELDFYRRRISDDFGIEVVIPGDEDRRMINDIIFRELCLGEISTVSRRCYLDAIERLRDRDAEAIILGCTEIGLLVQQAHCRLPLYDTTAIHADAAVEFALADSDGTDTP